MLRDLVMANRSYRRFIESERIAESTLRELVDMARCTPSAANLQSMKYMLVTSENQCEGVFSTLKWAGYLADWDGPKNGERPSAYIIILGDSNISKNPFCDHGITSQTILLGAVEKGLGGCILASIDRDSLRESLNIDEQFDIHLVIALGKPAETVVLEDIESDGSIKYYRDAEDTHHVPKRKLDDIILPLP